MQHKKSHQQQPSGSRLPARKAIAACLLALHVVLPAHAVELGDIRVHSWLGKQIKASVPLGGDDARTSEARCFKGVLVNLHGEPVSALRTTLQHTTTGSLLLLFGGSAVDEPAATVVVENVCGTGGSREYAVLLDLVPQASVAPAPVPEDASPAQQVARDNSAARAGNAVPAAEEAATFIPDTIYPIPGMPSMRMAAMLSTPNAGRVRRTVHAPLQPATEDAFSAARLTMASGLASFARPASDEHGGMKATVIVAFALGALMAAIAWIVMRMRAMRTAEQPWLPIDMRIDAGTGNTRTAERLSS